MILFFLLLHFHLSGIMLYSLWLLHTYIYCSCFLFFLMNKFVGCPYVFFALLLPLSSFEVTKMLILSIFCSPRPSVILWWKYSLRGLIFFTNLLYICLFNFFSNPLCTMYIHVFHPVCVYRSGLYACDPSPSLSTVHWAHLVDRGPPTVPGLFLYIYILYSEFSPGLFI